jgi:RNA polymerase sigma factor (sigma-70 family)
VVGPHYFGRTGNLPGAVRIGCGVSASLRVDATATEDGLELDSAAAEGTVEPAAADLLPVGPGVGGRTFEDVYRSDYARMVRAAHLLTGSNESAEEIVQDAFVALYPRFALLDDPSGYLYRSVVNGCLTQHRRGRVVQRLRHLTAAGDAAPPEFDETWHALKRLPPRRRAAVVLRYYADLPLAEIAAVLGCQVGTVKSMLHRALAQLKDVIGA